MMPYLKFFFFNSFSQTNTSLKRFYKFFIQHISFGISVTWTATYIRWVCEQPVFIYFLLSTSFFTYLLVYFIGTWDRERDRDRESKRAKQYSRKTISVCEVRFGHISCSSLDLLRLNSPFTPRTESSFVSLYPYTYICTIRIQVQFLCLYPLPQARRENHYGRRRRRHILLSYSIYVWPCSPNRLLRVYTDLSIYMYQSL